MDEQLKEIVERCISQLLEGDYDDGEHPVVANVIEQLREGVKTAESH